MSAAFRVELRRLFARRLIKALILLAVMGCLVGAVITFFTSAGTDAIAQAEQQHQMMFERCQRGEFFGPGEFPEGSESKEAFCEEAVPSAAELSSSFVYERMGEEGLLGTAPLLMIIGMLIGASFIGAEWQAGTMTTLLTWEPRRLRVIASKMLAAVTGAISIVFLLQAFLLLVLLPVAIARGTTEGVDADWIVQAAATAGRISLGAGICTLLGFSIATIGRNTAAALGAGFAYFAIIESLLRGFKPQWQPWFVADNLIALVVDDPLQTQEIGHTALEGGLLVAAYAALLFVIAALFFRQRDVT